MMNLAEARRMARSVSDTVGPCDAVVVLDRSGEYDVVYFPNAVRDPQAYLDADFPGYIERYHLTVVA